MQFRHPIGRIALALVRAAVLICLLLSGPGARAASPPAPKGDAVTVWTLQADFYGRNSANWRSLAIMHEAMHDALNAAQPVYARWWPPGADEPPAAGASPQAAMAAAANQVLLLLHPDRRDETTALFRAALSRVPNGAAKEEGIRLGTAIGSAAVQRRADDGSKQDRMFAGTDAPGRWRPTPNSFATSPTNDTKPFLFPADATVPAEPPPELGSPAYQQQRAETLRIGGLDSAARKPDETVSGIFWASQSSQRGYVYLAVRLFAAHPRGMAEEAQRMSQLTSALADSAILVWHEKEKFSFWRPVTAIRLEQKDSKAASAWQPLVETPPFPEYPSGHAADCFTGAGVLEAAFPKLPGPVVYIASTAIQPLHPDPTSGAAASDSFGMGQHAQPVQSFLDERRFPSLAASAQDCALSRIWAGAHFRAADDEAKRLADLIVQQALTSAPRLK